MTDDAWDAGASADHETSRRSLYDDAPCALLSTLPDGGIVHVNRTFVEWLAVTAADVVGRVRFQDLLTMGSRIYYETHYAPLLRMQGFVSEIALEVRSPGGRVSPVVASARLRRDADGTPLRVDVALFDSTDRRRYERELLHARKSAETASRSLEAADRRKNEFIAMLAHELRNPLAPIRVAVELQRRQTGLDTAARDVNEMMRRQVDQIVRLVEDLLDVSRVGQDKLSIRKAPVDLASIIHHAVEASEPLLRNADARLDVQLPAEPIYAEADAARLVQVIGNLLNNAAKFTPPNGHVTLTLARDGAQATIAVRDDGIGIAPGELPHVFDMFMQGTASPERKGGLGIGLTLSRSLIERHGGRLSVRSEGLGRGAEFTIHLPALVDVPPRVVHAAPAADPVPHQVPRRILVVDDNRDSAQLMAMVLELEGHDVRQADDGAKALGAVADFDPDAVLLDIGLPDMDGYQVAARIRTGGTARPRLIAVTGWGQDEDRRRAEAAGFDAHLTKPVDPEALTRLLAELAVP